MKNYDDYRLYNTYLLGFTAGQEGRAVDNPFLASTCEAFNAWEQGKLDGLNREEAAVWAELVRERGW